MYQSRRVQRLFQVIAQYLREKNAKNFLIPSKELRVGESGAYEVWSTGYVASCDYGGMIFTYGYYALACIYGILLVFLVIILAFSLIRRL